MQGPFVMIFIFLGMLLGAWLIIMFPWRWNYDRQNARNAELEAGLVTLSNAVESWLDDSNEATLSNLDELQAFITGERSDWDTWSSDELLDRYTTALDMLQAAVNECEVAINEGADCDDSTIRALVYAAERIIAAMHGALEADDA